MNLNNRLLGGNFAILQSSGLSFFSFISKNICKLFVSKTRIVENISAASFLFSRNEIKNEACYSLPYENVVVCCTNQIEQMQLLDKKRQIVIDIYQKP